MLSLWDWPLTSKTIILQCYNTVGWVIWPVKSSPKWPMMCRVKPYNTIQYHTCFLCFGRKWRHFFGSRDSGLMQWGTVFVGVGVRDPVDVQTSTTPSRSTRGYELASKPVHDLPLPSAVACRAPQVTSLIRRDQPSLWGMCALFLDRFLKIGPVSRIIHRESLRNSWKFQGPHRPLFQGVI